MRLRKLLLPGVVSLAFVATPLAYAKDGADQYAKKPGKQCHKKHKRGEFFMKLSPEQRQEIKEILKSHKSEIVPLRKEMRALHQQMKAQYKNGEPSWNEIQAINQKMNVVKDQMSLLKAKIKFEVYKKTGLILPPKKGGHHKHHKKAMKQG